MNSISLPVSDEPISGFTRVAYHENLVISRDLNMTQEIRVVTHNREGVPILEALGELSPEQRRAAEVRYRDQFVSRTTAGAVVDQTGKPVETSTEETVSQLAFFQSICIDDLKAAGMQINGKTPVLSMFYAMIQQEIGKLDKRAVL
ncbi:hypothetical protein CLV58_101173 [Spirosoma oryzae]|uniref:Uncharacterized protein n=1 Tax=Spirosoma oryzae TaxID=1469603 RepID=A0A2T0TN74_9BACT|nr:hypothetical protein [Spirosoma oryzae]PRY47107.1 hypothetical protein CLV58_101173 [Spirosoma oryzae]